MKAFVPQNVHLYAETSLIGGTLLVAHRTGIDCMQ